MSLIGSTSNTQTLLDKVRSDLSEKERQLTEANKLVAKLQNQLDENIATSRDFELRFAEAWKENKTLKKVIARESEEVRTVYEKTKTIMKKHNDLVAQYNECISALKILKDEKNDSYTSHIAKLETKKNELENALSAVTSDLTSKKEQLENLEAKYNRLQHELEVLTADPEKCAKADLLEKIANKEAEIESLTSQVVQSQMQKYDIKVDDEKKPNDEDLQNYHLECPIANDQLLSQYLNDINDDLQEFAQQYEEPDIDIEDIKPGENARERKLCTRILELELLLKEKEELLKEKENLLKQYEESSEKVRPLDKNRPDQLNIPTLTTETEEKEELDPNELGATEVSAIAPNANSEEDHSDNDQPITKAEYRRGLSQLKQELAQKIEQEISKSQPSSPLKQPQQQDESIEEEESESDDPNPQENQDPAVEAAQETANENLEVQTRDINIDNAADDIEALKSQLKESQEHSKELQEILDSINTANSQGVVDLVKENQKLKKQVENKDQKIAEATEKGAEILEKYREQQETLQNMINEMRALKTKCLEQTAQLADSEQQLNELQQERDEAVEELESFKEDFQKLEQLDELAAKNILIQTELDGTKLRLENATKLLKTKGGPRAYYAYEVYDQIVDYQVEIAALTELVHNLEEEFRVELNSLYNLIDKEGQPRPDLEKKEEENEEELENKAREEEARKLRNKEKLHAFLQNMKPSLSTDQDNNDNFFFQSGNQLSQQYDQLSQENQKLKTILRQVESELHLPPNSLVDREINQDEVTTDENGQQVGLAEGWLNQLVAESTNGGGFVVNDYKERDIQLEEEEKINAHEQMDLLTSENESVKFKLMESEQKIEQLNRSLIELNNKFTVLNTDRLAAVQANNVLTDKVVELKKDIDRMKAGRDNSLNASLIKSEMESRQKDELANEEIRNLRQELGRAKAEADRCGELENRCKELSTRIEELNNEKSELEKKLTEAELNAQPSGNTGYSQDQLNQFEQGIEKVMKNILNE